jgi:hypothetical protein
MIYILIILYVANELLTYHYTDSYILCYVVYLVGEEEGGVHSSEGLGRVRPPHHGTDVALRRPATHIQTQNKI